MPEMQGMRVRFLVPEDPLEKGMAAHSNILAWKIPWTEEPTGPQSKGLQRVRHWATNTFTFMLMTVCFMQWTCHKLFNHCGNFEQKVREVCQLTCYFLPRSFPKIPGKKIQGQKVEYFCCCWQMWRGNSSSKLFLLITQAITNGWVCLLPTVKCYYDF